MLSHAPFYLYLPLSAIVVVQASAAYSGNHRNVNFASELRQITNCEPLEDYGTLRRAYMRHYLSDRDYDAYRGHDLIHGPVRPHDVPSANGRPQATLCIGEETEKGQWFVQRIGPFRSTGGNDWWQFAWNDAFKLEAYGIWNANQTVGITAHATMAVTPDLEPIGLPPLHMHHVHIGPDQSLDADIFKCMREGLECPDAGFLFNHHGDQQHSDPERKFETFGEECSTGFSKRVHRPVTVTGEINDWRPAGSEGLEWWYQVAIRVVRGPKAKATSAVSVHSLFNPQGSMFLSQMDRFFVYKVPSLQDTVLYYTGRMPFGGEMQWMQPHVHMGVAQQMFLFQGTPQDLGLEVVHPKNSYQPVDAVDVLETMGIQPRSEPAGGANNQYIVDWILEKAKQGPARQICHAQATRVNVNGKSWDRMANFSCNPWKFEMGMQFTAVAFNGNPDANDLITRFKQHSIWFLTYASRDEYGRYTFTLGSTDPDAFRP